MKNLFVTSALVCMAALGAAVLCVLSVAAQSTTFTYQGLFNEGTAPANGKYDIHFRLFTAATGGVQLGTMLCSDDVEVSMACSPHSSILASSTRPRPSAISRSKSVASAARAART